MKYVVLIFLFPLFCQGQMTDTTCVKARWIACKPIEANCAMFPFAKDSIEKLRINIP